MGTGSFDYAPTGSAQDEAVLPLRLREREGAREAGRVRGSQPRARNGSSPLTSPLPRNGSLLSESRRALPQGERKFAVSFEQLSVISAKAVALGETGGDDTARLGARADPIVERRLGAYAVLSLAPAQPIGEAEDFGVGEAAILVAL